MKHTLQVHESHNSRISSAEEACAAALASKMAASLTVCMAPILFSLAFPFRKAGVKSSKDPPASFSKIRPEVRDPALLSNPVAVQEEHTILCIRDPSQLADSSRWTTPNTMALIQHVPPICWGLHGFPFFFLDLPTTGASPFSNSKAFRVDAIL